MPVDPSCLFCRIVAGEIPAQRVWESDTALAFRDISPQAPTHVLVIPRAHHVNAAALAAADPDTVAELVTAAHEIAAAAGLAPEPDGPVGEGSADAAAGYRLVFNTGAGAGQTVFHVHLHLLAGRPLTWPPG